MEPAATSSGTVGAFTGETVAANLDREEKPDCAWESNPALSTGPRSFAHGPIRHRQALTPTRFPAPLKEFKAIRRGWCLGEETFRQELLAQMSERLGAEHYGEERAETEEAKAERIIAEELKRRKWKATELQNRPEGDAEKVALAARLRAWKRVGS